jgi:hypothetical protein
MNDFCLGYMGKAYPNEILNRACPFVYGVLPYLFSTVHPIFSSGQTRQNGQNLLYT